MRVTLTCSGSVDTFDEGAFMRFLIAFLKALFGWDLTADQIQLTVRAGSLVVDFVVAPPSSSPTNSSAAASVLAGKTTTELSSSLGVTVEQSYAASSTMMVNGPSPPPPSPPQPPSPPPPPSPPIHVACGCDRLEFSPIAHIGGVCKKNGGSVCYQPTGDPNSPSRGCPSDMAFCDDAAGSAGCADVLKSRKCARKKLKGKCNKKRMKRKCGKTCGSCMMG